MEMGAQVQCNNCLSCFDSKKDGWTDIKMSMNLGDAWPACGTEMMLKPSQSCSIFKQDAIESCSEDDKEILKQTMLKHEEIFRAQVRELHRLYKVQKVLMNDLKRKDFNTKQGDFLFHFGPEQTTSKDKRNIWDFLNGSVKERDGRDHIHSSLGINYMKAPGFGLMDQNTPIVLNSKDINGGSKDCSKLQPIRATCRTFDLERPADEYVDYEVMDQIREDNVSGRTVNDNGQESKLSKFESNLEPENDVQLTLSTGWEISKKKDDKRTVSLLDVGYHNKERELKTAKQSGINDETTLFSASSTRAEVHTQGVPGKERSVLSNQSFLGELWGLGQDYQKHEDQKLDWQKFGTAPEKGIKESQSLDIEPEPWFVNENTSTQNLTWQNPLASCQTIQPEANGINKVSLGRHEVQSICFHQQKCKGNSWSKEHSNLTSATKTLVGSPGGITLAPLLRSHYSIFQQETQNLQDGIQLSALRKKNEHSFTEIPSGVQSMSYTVAPASVSVQTQNFDLESSSRGQALICDSTPGTNAIRDASKFDGFKCYTNCNQLNSSCNQFSLSSLGQDLSQSMSADRTRSIHQQSAFYATPASTPSLSGFLFNSQEENSSSLKSPYINQLLHLEVSRGQNAEKGSQVSCHDEHNVANKVDLTLVLSNSAIKNVNSDASVHFNVKDQADSTCQENIENKNKANQGLCQGSEHIIREYTERSACFTVGTELLVGVRDQRSNPVGMFSPMKTIGSFDLIGQHLPMQKSICNSSVRHLEDQPVDRVVPVDRTQNLNFSLAFDSAPNSSNVLKGKDDVSDLQARDGGGVLKLGIIENQEYNEQSFASTDQIFGNTSAHGTTCLVGCDIQVATARHVQSSNTNRAEHGFSFSDCKQTSEAECQFPSSSLASQAEIQVPFHTHPCEKTAQSLNLNVTRNSGMFSTHTVTENENYKGVERPSQVECIEAYFQEEDADKLGRERESFTNTSLQVPFSGASPAKASQGSCVNQQNLKCLKEPLHHSVPMGIKMVHEDKVEDNRGIEEANSELLSTKLVANIDKSDVQEDSRLILHSAKDSSCIAEITGMEKAVSFEVRDLSESIHLAAEALLKIRSENLKPLGVRNSSGMRSSLEWFANMIPGSTDCLEFSSDGYREIDDSFPFPDTFAVAKERDFIENLKQPKEPSCSSNSDLDFFESMTLMLPESNEEEHCKQFVKNFEELEEKNSPSVNHTIRTPKRGKRVRDFQKEILPSISSLSRQEVTEDMQTIGGIMRSRGDAFYIGFKRRNAGGTHSLNEDWLIPSRARRSRYMPVSSSIWPKSYNQELHRLNEVSLSRMWGETAGRRHNKMKCPDLNPP